MITIAPLTVKDHPVSPHVRRRALRENLEMEDQTMTRTKIDMGSVGDQRFLYRLAERGRSRAKSYRLEALGPLVQSHQIAMGKRGPGSHLDLPANSKVPRSR